jgi:JAB1/Mov34/MPN/PAD-1 ubiquitin protease
MTITFSTPEQVIVHPLVLLSVTDHYSRSANNTKKRVVGVLLGQQNGNQVNVANSYAGMDIFHCPISHFSLGNKFILKRGPYQGANEHFLT